MRHSGGGNAVMMRILAGEFYRQHAGFFLLSFLLCFGVFDASATIRLHHGLMQMMAVRPAALATGLAIWGLYFLKVLLYSLRTLGAPACRFLCESQALSAGRAWQGMLPPVMLMALPALIYNGVAAGIAFREGKSWAAICLTGFPLLAASGIAQLCLRRLRRMHVASWFAGWDRLPRFVADPRMVYTRWPLAHLLAERRLLLLCIKALSLLMIQGLMWVNESRIQREGTYFMLLLMVTIHTALPYHVVRFLERNPWLRAMPVSVLSRHAQLCALWALLALPELLYLLLHRPPTLSIGLALSLCLLLVALLSVLHAAAYRRGGDMGRYLTVVLLALPVTLFLLTSAPVWIMAIGWGIIGMIGFAWVYPRYESRGLD